MHTYRDEHDGSAVINQFATDVPESVARSTKGCSNKAAYLGR